MDDCENQPGTVGRRLGFRQEENLEFEIGH